jgi:hypothetical protein
VTRVPAGDFVEELSLFTGQSPMLIGRVTRGGHRIGKGSL